MASLVTGLALPQRLCGSLKSLTRQQFLAQCPRAFATVRISNERLEEFVNAELNVFARRTDRPLKPVEFQEILRMSGTPETLALLVHEELPVRFSRRLKHIERIADWKRIPQLVALHEMHLKSFRELRLADPGDVSEYTLTILRIRQRHKSIAPLFAGALRHIDKASIACDDEAEVAAETEGASASVGRNSLDVWADAFLSSRVSTEIQMSHYLARAGALSADGAADPTKVGILDMRCNPGEICRMAAGELADRGLQAEIDIEIPCGEVEFCHAPRYLFYIMVELLKNSAQATEALCSQIGAVAGSRPIRLAVCADERQVVIRISDRGGGFQLGGDMWSYTRVADSKENKQDILPQASSVVEPVLPGAGLPARPWGVVRGQSPIAAQGIGMPLSRLYARYLGGSLEVINMPGLGVDAFLFLNRITLE